MNRDAISLLNIRIAGKPLIDAGSQPFTPLGALYVSSALRDANFEIEFFDYLPHLRSVEVYEDDLLKFLEDKGDTLAISTIFVDLPFLLPAIERLKGEDPAKIIVLGGPGVAGIGEEIIRAFPSVDAVIEGEGEKASVEVMRQLLGLEKIHRTPGALIHKGDTVLKGQCRPRLNDLDDLPGPSYDLMPLNVYEKACISSSRGCRYSCSFCSIPTTWGNKISLRSMGKMVEEIELLVNHYGITHFSLVDDVFTLSKPRVIDFCREITGRKLEITWDCFGRIELFDPMTLALMVEHGLTNIYYGIESGSDKVLEVLNKGFDTQQAINVVNATKILCPVTASFIWGYPFESMDEFKKTLSLIEYLINNDVEIQQSALCPLPGTPLHHAYQKDLVFSIHKIPNATGLSGDELLDEIDLVNSHPDIFSGFYQLNHPYLNDKWEMADSFGLVFDSKINK